MQTKMLAKRPAGVSIALTSPDHFRLDLKETAPQVRLLFFDLTHFSRPIQFALCSLAVFALFLVYGYLLEFVFSIPEYSNFSWYLTLIQFAVYSTCAYSERKIRKEETTRKIPLNKHVQLAFYTVVTIGMSNMALKYLNYPTQVIFKCCKLIPVLLGGILIQGKTYGILDFTAAGLMSVGLILFTLTNVSITPDFNLNGYIVISVALTADAIIGNVQEKEIKKCAASNSEVVFYSYSIGFLYILIIAFCSGELVSALLLHNEHTAKFYFCATIFSLVGYLGVDVVITLVKTFGAFTAVTVTTFRKAVSIVLSFLFFAKPFFFQYAWSGLIIALGIYVSTVSKNQQALKKLEALRLSFWNCLNRSNSPSNISKVATAESV